MPLDRCAFLFSDITNMALLARVDDSVAIALLLLCMTVVFTYLWRCWNRTDDVHRLPLAPGGHLILGNKWQIRLENSNVWLLKCRQAREPVEECA